MEIAFFDNEMSRKLSPIDRARAMQAIMNQRGLSVRHAAVYFFGNARKKGQVENILRVLRCDPDVLAIITDSEDSRISAARIQTVTDPKFRKDLIAQAKAGASMASIAKQIQDHRRRTQRPGDKPSSGDSDVKLLPRINISESISAATSILRSAADALGGGVAERQTVVSKREWRRQLAITREVIESIEILIPGAKPPGRPKGR